MLSLAALRAAQLGEGVWAGDAATSLAEDGHVTEFGAQLLLPRFGL